MKQNLNKQQSGCNENPPRANVVFESNAERLDILKSTWTHLQEELYRAEAVENKTTFAVCSLIILIPSFIVKEEVTIYWGMKAALMAFIFSVGLLTIAFLIRNSGRIRWTCKSIVRVQQALHLFDNDFFIDTNKFKQFEQNPFSGTTILPPDGLTWGQGDWMLSLWPHLASIIISATAAIVFIGTK